MHNCHQINSRLYALNYKEGWSDELLLKYDQQSTRSHKLVYMISCISFNTEIIII